jgi:small-conductance mechanosensitive channel
MDKSKIMNVAMGVVLIACAVGLVVAQKKLDLSVELSGAGIALLGVGLWFVRAPTTATQLPPPQDPPKP